MTNGMHIHAAIQKLVQLAEAQPEADRDYLRVAYPLLACATQLVDALGEIGQYPVRSDFETTEHVHTLRSFAGEYRKWWNERVCPLGAKIHQTSYENACKTILSEDFLLG